MIKTIPDFSLSDIPQKSIFNNKYLPDGLIHTLENKKFFFICQSWLGEGIF